MENYRDSLWSEWSSECLNMLDPVHSSLVVDLINYRLTSKSSSTIGLNLHDIMDHN
jgi:hypothetical protein